MRIIPSLSSLVFLLYACNESSSKVVRTVLKSSFNDVSGTRVKTVGSETCGRNELSSDNDETAADTELLMVVDSKLADVHKRSRLRSDLRRWLDGRSDRVSVMFFIEESAKNAMLEKTLMMELLGGNNDIVWTNVSTTDVQYSAHKSLSWLQWVNEQCSFAQFVLKTEIDTLIHIPALLLFLRRTVSSVPPNRSSANHVPLKNKIWGSVTTADSINLRHIFEYPDIDYQSPLADEMPYCSGDTFLMTGDVVKKLYNGILRHDDGMTENYSPTRFITGAVAGKEHVNLVNDDRFKTIKLSSTGGNNASQNCYYLRNHFVYKIDVNSRNEL